MLSSGTLSTDLSTQAQSLAKLLREVEKFLDECDESVAEALAAHYSFSLASEAIADALGFHAGNLEAALADEPNE